MYPSKDFDNGSRSEFGGLLDDASILARIRRSESYNMDAVEETEALAALRERIAQMKEQTDE